MHLRPKGQGLSRTPALFIPTGLLAALGICGSPVSKNTLLLGDSVNRGRRTLLGHLRYPDVTMPIAQARLQYIRSRTTKTAKIMTRAASNRSISLKRALLEGPVSR